ncbi:MAG TPA: hypothetical protein VHA07_07150, partial [Devosia sp.]|nr:hypothetical protein [Devosia sp.]
GPLSRMTRPDPDGLESVSQHDGSPGVVRDDELMCRGAFDPMHYERGKVRSSFIKNGDLLAGELSVWRGGTVRHSDDYITAVQKIREHGPSGHSLRDIFSPSAGAIRDIRLDGHERVFYVIDDCRTDKDGAWDQLHAAIKIALGLKVASREDDLYVRAKAELRRVFLANSDPDLASALADR